MSRLRMTPALEAGIVDTLRSMSDLVALIDAFDEGQPVSPRGASRRQSERSCEARRDPHGDSECILIAILLVVGTISVAPEYGEGYGIPPIRCASA
jgi:hypothetical protein